MLVKVPRIWTEVPYMLPRSSHIEKQDRRCRRDKEQDRRCRLDMHKLSIKVMDVIGRRMVTREFYIKILDTRKSTWTSQLTLPRCQTRSCNSTTSRCTTLMVTTDWMVVSWSRVSSTGMETGQTTSQVVAAAAR